jgi:acetylornithine deacetylase/succinyl-diaminopimelate desuccinylase-like protein
MACIGFGPGDDLLAHTVKESIPIAQIQTALDCNEALGRQLGAALAAGAA